jgi:hypothetical protein
MFKALARIEARTPASWVALTHSNDNFERRVAAAPARGRAPRLACRWHADPTNGRLECHWQVEQQDDGSEQSEGPAVDPMKWGALLSGRAQIAA